MLIDYKIGSLSKLFKYNTILIIFNSVYKYVLD